MPSGHADWTIRPEYYDRAPLPQLLNFSAFALGPHAATVRASYTVPSGKRAYIELARSFIRRNTAATAVSEVRGTINLNSTDALTNTLVHTEFLDNATTARHDQVVGVSGLLVAADVVRILTQDAGTGGTCSYYLTAKAVEFTV